MANDKFRVVSSNGVPGFQHGAGKVSTDVERPSGATIEESHRLVQAFWRIRDPNRRAWLLEQVERIADLKSTKD